MILLFYGISGRSTTYRIWVYCFMVFLVGRRLTEYDFIVLMVFESVDDSQNAIFMYNWYLGRERPLRMPFLWIMAVGFLLGFVFVFLFCFFVLFCFFYFCLDMDIDEYGYYVVFIVFFVIYLLYLLQFVYVLYTILFF